MYVNMPQQREPVLAEGEVSKFHLGVTYADWIEANTTLR